MQHFGVVGVRNGQGRLTDPPDGAIDVDGSVIEDPARRPARHVFHDQDTNGLAGLLAH